MSERSVLQGSDRTDLPLGSQQAPQSRSSRPVPLRVASVPALDGHGSQVHLLDEPAGRGRVSAAPGSSLAAGRAAPPGPAAAERRPLTHGTGTCSVPSHPDSTRPFPGLTFGVGGTCVSDEDN